MKLERYRGPFARAHVRWGRGVCDDCGGPARIVLSWHDGTGKYHLWCGACAYERIAYDGVGRPRDDTSRR